MANAAQTRAAAAYAHKAGYDLGARYSPFDLPGVSFTAHRGHGAIVYHGISNGALEFSCDGCRDTIFVLPGTDDESEGGDE